MVLSVLPETPGILPFSMVSENKMKRLQQFKELYYMTYILSTHIMWIMDLT